MDLLKDMTSPTAFIMEVDGMSSTDSGTLLNMSSLKCCRGTETSVILFSLFRKLIFKFCLHLVPKIKFKIVSVRSKTRNLSLRYYR